MEIKQKQNDNNTINICIIYLYNNNNIYMHYLLQIICDKSILTTKSKKQSINFPGSHKEFIRKTKQSQNMYQNVENKLKI